MTEIKFYVTRSEEQSSRLMLACQLTQKALQHQMHVYIHVESAVMAEQLDSLLWEFNDESFIAHELAPTDTKVEVLIGYDFEPMTECDYLINLTGERPAFFARYAKLAEIISQEPTVLNKGRDRYRFYKDRGYKLDYYKL
ncbi:MAG: DNA polymerase III subunit chi [Thiotrichaceae bacterium]|nr:DNA polymerase III subunit chi [Thiotrichaceae bacterium]